MDERSCDMTCNSPTINESNPLQIFTRCLQASDPVIVWNGMSSSLVTFEIPAARVVGFTSKPTKRTLLHVENSKISAPTVLLNSLMNATRSNKLIPSVVSCFATSMLFESNLSDSRHILPCIFDSSTWLESVRMPEASVSNCTNKSDIRTSASCCGLVKTIQQFVNDSKEYYVSLPRRVEYFHNSHRVNRMPKGC